jgi:hypothetical protein
VFEWSKPILDDPPKTASHRAADSVAKAAAVTGPPSARVPHKLLDLLALKNRFYKSEFIRINNAAQRLCIAYGNYCTDQIYARVGRNVL